MVLIVLHILLQNTSFKYFLHSIIDNRVMSTQESIERFCKAEINLKNIASKHKGLTKQLNQTQKEFKKYNFQFDWDRR